MINDLTLSRQILAADSAPSSSIPLDKMDSMREARTIGQYVRREIARTINQLIVR